MSIKTPRLIRDRCGVFYFRFLVPLDWRATVGKAEIRRSLRTKDAGRARVAALLLSARMEAMMVDRKFLTNPTLADFEHLSRREPDIREKIRIDLERGVVETDTLEEAKEARGIVEQMARARMAAEKAVAELPSSRCGTALEQAATDFLAERQTTLSAKGTMPKLRGVLRAFIAFAGNIDVAMVLPTVAKDYKKKLLAEGKAPTTINDHLVALTGFFDYCIDNKLARIENPARGLLIPGAHNKAESYLPFTDEEMAKIFEPGAYLKRMRMPDYHWGPLIAAFTGARAEEIASLKVEQNIYADHLQNKGLPTGTPGRVSLPVAGDDAAAKQKVMLLVEELGFDAVDDGSLHASWRQQPGTPCYGADLPADELRELFATLGTHRTEAQHLEYLANHAKQEQAMAAAQGIKSK